MKCYFCDKPGSICFSAWPDQDNLCLCDEHITDAHLLKVQRLLRAKSRTAPTLEEMKRLRRAS